MNNTLTQFRDTAGNILLSFKTFSGVTLMIDDEVVYNGETFVINREERYKNEDGNSVYTYDVTKKGDS